MWDIECKNETILRSEIFYCEVNNTKEVKTKKISKPNITYTKINGLKPNTNYEMCLRVDTSGGTYYR